ncbi:hypothetical protein Tco_0038169 [Tanacetum coccineum]
MNCNPNQFYHDDLVPHMKSWELILRENVHCFVGNTDPVNACTTYMFYYLETSQKLNLAYYIAHRIEDIKRREKFMISYDMLLTRKGKRALSTSHSPPSSPKIAEDDEPSPLTFFRDLLNDPTLSYDVKEKQGMF